jgi:hypothetical protein
VVEFLNHDWSLYAKCPVAQDYQESIAKCTDSSRGFAVKLMSDDGRSMWVGLGFHDRNDAFDFQCCFHDFAARRENLKNPTAFETDIGPKIDFSLGAGEKFSVSIGSGKTHQGSTGGNGNIRNQNFGSGTFFAFPY